MLVHVAVQLVMRLNCLLWMGAHEFHWDKKFPKYILDYSFYIYVLRLRCRK